MAAFFGLWMLILGLIMLISPRTVFQLPYGLGFTGSLRKEEYSKGWGAIQLRIFGAILIGTIIWVIYDAFFALRYKEVKLDGMFLMLGRVIQGIAVLLGLINGLPMIVSPRAWYRLPRWLRISWSSLGKEQSSSKWSAIRLRIIGFLIIAIATWIIFAIFR